MGDSGKRKKIAAMGTLFVDRVEELHVFDKDLLALEAGKRPDGSPGLPQGGLLLALYIYWAAHRTAVT